MPASPCPSEVLGRWRMSTLVSALGWSLEVSGGGDGELKSDLGFVIVPADHVIEAR
jgi:hypothetical protein